LLRQSEPFAVDLFENNIAASAEKCFADFFSEAHGIGALASFAQNLGSIGMGYERVEANAASVYFGESSDGHLAAAAEFTEQGALARGGSAGGSIIEKYQERPRCGVAVANFDSQSTLSSGGGHHPRWYHLANQLRFAQSIQAGGGQNDGIVVAGFELTQARVNVATQRLNLKV
jgi:hypothetical protein